MVMVRPKIQGLFWHEKSNDYLDMGKFCDYFQMGNLITILTWENPMIIFKWEFQWLFWHGKI